MNFQENQMHDLISIIIPAYNSEKYILRCINSVLHQTYKNIEVIVVDDGSTDSTYNKISTIKDSRLYIIRKENAGVSEARNCGLSRAKGNYIGFVDSDDYIKPSMIECMYKHILHSDCVMVNHNGIKSDGTEEKSNMFFKEGNYNAEEIIDLILEHKIGANVWRCLFKRANIEKNRISFPKIKMSEDMIFIMEYLLNAQKVTVVEDGLYLYNLSNQDSAINNMWKYKRDVIAYPSLLINTFRKTKRYEKFEIKLAKEVVIVAMSVRMNYLYKEFKRICKSTEFNQNFDKNLIRKIPDRKYKIYYWAMCHRLYFICNIGYIFNFIKTRFYRMKSGLKNKFEAKKC